MTKSKKTELSIEYVDTKKLIPYSNNAKEHPQEQIDQIAASIKEFSMCDPIAVDDDYTIIEGHGRLLALQKLGIKTTPIIKLGHLTEYQRKAYIIAHNKLTMNSGFDMEILANELSFLDDVDFDLSLTGFDDDELEALLFEETEGLTDEDEVPDVPEDPVSKLGDVWLLGDHRLMCGDSTDAGTVALLMDGNKADMVFTDPPYGIGYGGSMALGQEKHGWTQHKGGWDEERPSKEFFEYLQSLAPNQIIWGGNYFTDSLPPTMGWLVWDKGQRGFSLADGEMAWTSFDNAMRIKEYSRAKANKEEKHHATQKPIEILEWCIEYADRHSKTHPKSFIDLFGGSGSTLIACEKTKRICYMMELDPCYVSVIIKRWENYTGKKAVLENEKPIKRKATG